MELNEFEKTMAAVAFAEAGEHETAREMLSRSLETRKKPVKAGEKKRPVTQMLVFGMISLTAYIVLFTQERWVTTNYTMGGWYTFLPIGTALLFSFVHGAFASSFLSVLGIQAKH